MENREVALRNNSAKSKTQKTRVTEKEHGDCSLPIATASAKTSSKTSAKASTKASATRGTMTESLTGREPEKGAEKGLGKGTGEKQSPQKASGRSKAKAQEKQPKTSPAKSMNIVDIVAGSATASSAMASSAMAGDGVLDGSSLAGKHGAGKGELALANGGGPAGNNRSTRMNGNATDPVKVKARLYECRALCFVGERLWKPGEKQYSAVSLDVLHWELVTEEAEQKT